MLEVSSRNVTVPPSTVRPEASATETFAVSVAPDPLPVVRAGLGDALAVVCVGCALVCIVRLMHHDPTEPRFPPWLARLSRYSFQTLLACIPPNSPANVPVPVGPASTKVAGAGAGKVSALPGPCWFQLSVG